jgi:D-tyrosyl-tRNA(Tyr) deacylase
MVQFDAAMRAVLQRVSEASVSVDGQIVGQIDRGLVALVGVAAGDGPADVAWIAAKIAELRLFTEGAAGSEQSLGEIGGAALVISQFTLLGDCRKGRRPSWSAAALPDEARTLYEALVERLRARQIPVETGVFRAHMTVRIVNDGPVTVLLDSRKQF